MLENPWVTRGASIIAEDWPGGGGSDEENVVRQQQAQAVSKRCSIRAWRGGPLLSYEGLLAPTPFDGAGGRVAPYMGMGLLGTLP